MPTRAMLYCQHLAGIGHLVRSAELARSMSADGWEVLLVCGGNVPNDFPFPPSVRIELLEAIESDPEYKSLSASQADCALDDVKAGRTSRLLELLDAFCPDVIVTEMFPFGRKKFAFELLPLLEKAKASARQPLIVASVRDILVVKSDPESHERRVVEILNRLYDLVLVHSDELLQPLEATFASAKSIRPPVVHTGYIIASPVAEELTAMEFTRQLPIYLESEGEGPILVSCGSGRLHAGQQLLTAALCAAPCLAQSIRRKLLICAGPLVPPETFAHYQQLAARHANVLLVHDLPSLRSLLSRVSLSVSLGGYNTVMELLAARAQGLVLAAGPNGDTEQKTRVARLAARGLLHEINLEDLESGRLADRICEAIAYPSWTVDVQMDGAANSAKLLMTHLSRSARPIAHAPHSQELDGPRISSHEPAPRTVRQCTCA